MELFGIVALAIGGIVAFQLAKAFAEWTHNNGQPVRTASARLVTKRTEVSGGGESRARTSYYVTFELESGVRQEVSVDGEEYGQLAEGDTGAFSYQGTRYKGFVRR